jgi:hypothetical protein
MQTEITNGVNHAPVNRLPADVPAAEPQTAPSANAANGRGPGGRFAAGNPGGPGNPFARQVAQLRRALLSAVTPDEIAQVARKLFEQARDGDAASARLLYSYTVGKPSETVNPDKLDLDEWEMYRKMPVQDKDFAAVFNAPLAEALCRVLRICLPFLIDHQERQLAQLLGGTPPAKPANDCQQTDPPAQTPGKDQLPEPSAAPAAPAAAAAAAAVDAPQVRPPSPNRGNGAPLATPEAPAGDRGAPAIGDMPVDALLALLRGDDGLLSHGLPPRRYTVTKRRDSVLSISRLVENGKWAMGNG